MALEKKNYCKIGSSYVIIFWLILHDGSKKKKENMYRKNN